MFITPALHSNILTTPPKKPARRCQGLATAPSASCVQRLSPFCPVLEFRAGATVVARTVLGLPFGPQAELQGHPSGSCLTPQRTPHSTADDTSQWR